MDAKALYPKGFHPVFHHRLLEAHESAPVLPRSTAQIKYYYVDFGISTYIPRDSPTRMVTGVFGRDQEVPELSAEIPYDPFKVDVYILGNVFTEFIAVRAKLNEHYEDDLSSRRTDILEPWLFAAPRGVHEDERPESSSDS